ncbi:hypothetical protein [Vibrio hyugaensis]|uniref:hypothetical protein n=1 Tax=Vibrio hyugaensis TaxID=1534743 RepID=UPI000CE3ACC8|nr:hypothetical protein [Vibrio hyugaensis]
MKVKARLATYLMFTMVMLFIPWLISVNSSFTIEGQFNDRSVKFVGSHGRYKIGVNYSSNTYIVHSGYYTLVFDTLYLLKTERDEVAEGSAFQLNEFIRGHQTFVAFKLKHEHGNLYQLKHIEEDPREGITRYQVIVKGDLGFFWKIQQTFALWM